MEANEGGEAVVDAVADVREEGTTDGRRRTQATAAPAPAPAGERNVCRSAQTPSDTHLKYPRLPCKSLSDQP